MPDNVRELRSKPPETEKITINLGYVDLGHVDLMVQEGFYSNRTDFIRTAIRNQLERHADAVQRSVAKPEDGFTVQLLDGVTGSGKTEVYFEAVAAALAAGRQVLVL